MTGQRKELALGVARNLGQQGTFKGPLSQVPEAGARPASPRFSAANCERFGFLRLESFRLKISTYTCYHLRVEPGTATRYVLIGTIQPSLHDGPVLLIGSRQFTHQEGGVETGGRGAPGRVQISAWGEAGCNYVSFL